jgi:dTDP-L-rhamnose 4-epimerase
VPTTVSKVANTLKSLYDSDVNISVSGKYRLGDIRHNYADLSKIENVLGFIPKFDFVTGLTFFVNWVKTQEVVEDNYDKSVVELRNKGLIK